MSLDDVAGNMCFRLTKDIMVQIALDDAAGETCEALGGGMCWSTSFRTRACRSTS